MKKGQSIIAFILFAVISQSTQGNSDVARGHCSHAFGKAYYSEISRDALNKSPAWNTEDENPPLSARKAINLSDARFKKLVKDTEDYKWRREEAAVVFLGSKFCYWKITYEAWVTRGGSSGPPITIELFVLMDGTFIEPEVSDDE